MPAAAFIAKQRWIAEQGLRLDAGAYAGGALAVRDRVVEGPWAWRRLDAVVDLFTGARFARTYVPDSRYGVRYITGSDMLLADLTGLLYLSKKNTPQLPHLMIH